MGLPYPSEEPRGLNLAPPPHTLARTSSRRFREAAQRLSRSAARGAGARAGGAAAASVVASAGPARRCPSRRPTSRTFPGTYRPPGPTPWSPGGSSPAPAEDKEDARVGLHRHPRALLLPAPRGLRAPRAADGGGRTGAGSSAPRAGSAGGRGRVCGAGNAGAARAAAARNGPETELRARRALRSRVKPAFPKAPQIPLLIKSIHYAQI